MGQDISVLFKAQDQLTQEIQKMRASVKEMGKDVADYKSIQDKAFKEKAELQLDLRKAREDLKELAKLEKDGTEESKQNYIEKQKQVNEMIEGLKRYNQAINEANKAERELTTGRSRNNNNPNISSNEVSMVGQLMKVGMFKELGDAFGDAAGTYLTSAYGEKFGNRVGTMASSVISGAVMGSVVPGIGTAIGVGVGALTGGLNILSQEQKTNDEYFKSSVQSVLSEANTLKPDTDKGIELAGQREMDMISFETLLGSKENAEKYLKESEAFAAKTPFTSEGIDSNTKTMLTFGYNQNELFDKLTKIGDTSAALGLDQQNQQMVVTALGRMKSSDKTSLEYMNMLTERGIDGVGYLAEAMGTDKKTVYEMISKGSLSGVQSSEVIINTMGEKYKDAMEKMSKTYEGLMSTKEDVNEINLRKGATAYTEYRKEFIKAETEWDQKWGEQLAKNEALLKAKLESTKNTLVNQRLEEVMQTDEYKKAQNEQNGAELGRLEMEARTKAIIEYNNSPEAKAVMENELALIRSTQDYVRENGGFVELGQDVAEQFNRGWASQVNLEFNKNPGGLNLSDITLPKETPNKRYNGLNFSDITLPRKAVGGRIPDDNYFFIAHKNERVLTAQENAEYERNKGRDRGIVNNININVAGSNADAEEIANMVVFRIVEAVENLG